jgi:hypothetical protein
MTRLLERGMKRDNRFNSLITAIDLLMEESARPTYYKLKERIIEMDLDKSMERDTYETMLNALRRSHLSRDSNSGFSKDNKSSPAKINTISRADNDVKDNAHGSVNENTNIECFSCGGIGHIMRNCPNRNNNDDTGSQKSYGGKAGNSEKKNSNKFKKKDKRQSLNTTSIEDIHKRNVE